MADAPLAIPSIRKRKEGTLAKTTYVNEVAKVLEDSFALPSTGTPWVNLLAQSFSFPGTIVDAGPNGEPETDINTYWVMPAPRFLLVSKTVPLLVTNNAEAGPDGGQPLHLLPPGKIVRVFATGDVVTGTNWSMDTEPQRRVIAHVTGTRGDGLYDGFIVSPGIDDVLATAGSTAVGIDKQAAIIVNLRERTRTGNVIDLTNADDCYFPAVIRNRQNSGRKYVLFISDDQFGDCSTPP